MLTSAANVLTH